ncbi:MAG: YtxH domain-containing protein [Acidobacteria bacterium]|nr:YtxH domain-containing protein [Acidobacteriota bacterium]
MCGAAVGAAVGLLLAPKAGAELRQQIYDSTGRMRRSATDGYETVTHAVDDLVERGKRAAQRGVETYENVRQTATEATNAAARAVNDRM